MATNTRCTDTIYIVMEYDQFVRAVATNKTELADVLMPLVGNAEVSVQEWVLTAAGTWERVE